MQRLFCGGADAVVHQVEITYDMEPLAHTVLCFIVILCACKQESEHLLYTWFLRTDVALDIQLESLAALDDAA